MPGGRAPAHPLEGVPPTVKHNTPPRNCRLRRRSGGRCRHHRVVINAGVNCLWDAGVRLLPICARSPPRTETHQTRLTVGKPSVQARRPVVGRSAMFKPYRP